MFGMVLVALSIGFNTVRWPIVERMVGPVAEPVPAATPEPITHPPAAQPASPALAPPTAVKPVPDVEKSAGDKPLPTQAEQPADAVPVADEDSSAALTKQQNPLVPVPRLRTSAGPAAGIEYDGTIRRLPPVDPSESSPVPGNRPSPDGAIPVYPSTGIE
jgi:hypothetical protein